MGHPQPQTLIHVDNITCVGIANNTIKRQRPRAMEMRYFWLLCQTTQRYIKVYYQPGAENMGDFPSKAHTDHIHKHVRPYDVHRWLTLQESSPEQQGQGHGKGVLKYLEVPTTRESHFPVFQSTVTLSETLKWWNQQLRSQTLNKISSSIILMNEKIYLDVGACKARSLCNVTACVHDYHMLDSRHTLHLATCNKQYLATPN